MRKELVCPICRVPLEHTAGGWRCPECTFLYRVERGRVVSRPMWAEPEPKPSEEDEIRRVREEYGVEFTPEGLRFLKENPERFRRIVSRGRTS
jgi:uncharacterized Zn finger protein (UPF0148 family)